MPWTTDTLTAALQEQGITVGNLRETTDQNNNGTFTDDRTVFVKTNHGYTKGLARELEIATHIPEAIRPLLPIPLFLGEDEVATIWEHKPLVPFNGDAESLARELNRLHSTPLTGIPDQTLEPSYVDRTRSHADVRITDAANRGFSPEYLRMFKELRAVIPSFLRPPTGVPLVLCHNDLHLGNIAVCDGEILLIDWESVVAAPRELDYARLRLELPQDTYNALTAGVELNNELMNTYDKLIRLNKHLYSLRFPDRDETTKSEIAVLFAAWLQ